MHFHWKEFIWYSRIDLFFLVPLQIDTIYHSWYCHSAEMKFSYYWRNANRTDEGISKLSTILEWGFCLILSLKNSFLLLSRELLLYCLFYLWFYDYYESDISKMVFGKLYLLCNCRIFLSLEAYFESIIIGIGIKGHGLKLSLEDWIFKVLNWRIQWFKIQRVAVDLEIFWPNMP